MGGEMRDQATDEEEARAINAEPWEPMPGMVKRRCDWCLYWFAAPVLGHEPRCPDCVRAGSPPRIARAVPRGGSQR